MKKTTSDADIFRGILALTDDTGRGPGVRQLSKHLGRSPSGIHRRLVDMLENELIHEGLELRLTAKVIDHLTGPQKGTVAVSYLMTPAGLMLSNEPF